MLPILSKQRLILCCALAAAAAPAAAQTAADINNAARQGDTILRQQQERLREDQDSARRAVPPVEGADLRTPAPQPAPAAPAACRDIGEIRVAGASGLPPAQVSAVTRAFVGRCLGVGEIEALLGALTRLYIERGFITTRVYLPAQDLRGGILLIEVVEGVIERYRIDGDGAAIYVPGVFAPAPGEVLNLRALEQGIEQINRLASNNAQLDIEPGRLPGHSVVVVRNTRSAPLHLQLSLDNQGVDATGKDGAAAALTVDSPLHLNERFLLTHRATVGPERDAHRASSDGLEFWLPLGYSALTIGASRSHYLNLIALPSGAALRSEGDTTGASIGLDHVVARGQDQRSALTARLSTQRSDNYLAHQLLTVSSRTLATLELGGNTYAGALGGVFNGQLSYARGLRGFGALEDAPGLPAEAPRAQFRKLALDLSFSRSFSAGGRSLAWSSQWSGQYGFDTLYGSQQMLIGGQGSVRGFVNSTLSGDQGYFWRNELALPCRFALGAADAAGRVYAGYDVGRVASRTGSVAGGQLSGIALGVALQWRGLALDLSASRPVSLPAAMPRESGRLWLRLSSSI